MDFFTADLHLGHAKLADLRGFSSVEAHDDAVMSGLAELDPDGDVLWILGDICSGGVGSMRTALDRLRTLPVTMHLVTGNHDPVHPLNRGAQRHFPAFGAVFDSVQQFARAKVGGTGVLLSHFPYAGTPDRLGRDRYAQFQLPDEGRWLIHGHTHAPTPRSGTHSICVSLEAWSLRPASAVELSALIGRDGAATGESPSSGD